MTTRQSIGRTLTALLLGTGLVLACLVVLGTRRASAAVAGVTITVTTTDDELNGDGDCSLREAIQAANTDSAVDSCPAGSDADTVVLPAGTYTLTSGDLDVSSEITINGAAAHKASRGDLVIICSYAEYHEVEAVGHKPRLVYVDEHNLILEEKTKIA